MVYRIFVEKKPGLAHEAEALLYDLREVLRVEGLKDVRIFNRYDAENISEELFEYAVHTVFSEPQIDKAVRRLHLCGGISSGTVRPESLFGRRMHSDYFQRRTTDGQNRQSLCLIRKADRRSCFSD